LTIFVAVHNKPQLRH